MAVFSMATAMTGFAMFLVFAFIAAIIIVLRFPRTRGRIPARLFSGRRWLLWFVPCIAISAWGVILIASQSSAEILHQTHIKTVAQDRQGNAYIVFEDGETRPCAVAAECLAVPDDATITYRWEWHGDNTLLRIVGKG